MNKLFRFLFGWTRIFYRVKREVEELKNVFDLTGLTWEQAQEYALKGARITYIEWPKDEYVRWVGVRYSKYRGIACIQLDWQPTVTEKMSSGFAVIL
jgi:hypothetical protein